ncbi:Type II/IV secretion system ATP hydrolase TadA/VirB11/CpaF, TadA subfamily [hydrothermal vent metagenome]|uniref:Type II/IV secretion system ATP hydrolase TadA/VirB11/CpaF, TadA subfamily n=1 Tax=hydrothermal vent metagenome TaxID=652676 RepID=A0A3B0SBK3_9ZZZZ
MSLADRVKAAKAEDETTPTQRLEMRQDLRRRLHYKVVEGLGPTLYDQQMSDAELKLRVMEMLEWALDQEESVPLARVDRLQLLQEIADDVLGYGPIDPFLSDSDITEIMVNGPHSVWVEKAGRLTLTDVRFVDSTHLERIIEKIVGQVGRRIDESTPMVDARLPDGSRVNAVIHPLAIGGPFLTIRKFAVDPFTSEDLVTNDTFSEQVAGFVRRCVQGRLNVIVSGSTGSGKTTLLNVLSSYIPDSDRIVTIEDAAELRLNQRHVLSLESRPSNLEGKGQVTIRDLMRNTLRMRPDRIVVGEARGGEALDMLQAMNTGHDGSLTTIHSNAPRDTLARIETMVLMSGMDLPIRAIREQVASAVDLIVHLRRLRDGTRRVTHVTEVVGMEGEIITTQDLFLFDFGMGVDENGMYLGRLKATGIRPSFSDSLANYGIQLPADLFAPEPFARRA